MPRAETLRSRLVDATARARRRARSKGPPHPLPASRPATRPASRPTSQPDASPNTQPDAWPDAPHATASEADGDPRHAAGTWWQQLRRGQTPRPARRATPLAALSVDRSAATWAIASLAQHAGQACDLTALLGSLPLPCCVADLQAGLAACHLHADLRPSARRPEHHLRTSTLPALLVLTEAMPAAAAAPGPGTATAPANAATLPQTHAAPRPDGAAAEPATPPATTRLMLLCGVTTDTAWVAEPGDQAARQVSLASVTPALLGILTCRLLRAPGAAQADPDSPPRSRFGFGWFVPLLRRDRRLWCDVLTASLVLQLIALLTPLCTQVVIDKVLVHHTRSTLAVVCGALLLFIAVGAVLTGLRQALLLHVANRLDARLGDTVFAHLLALPLRYYEQRPTGVIAARLQAIETLRQFVASSLVTLLLDAPFLVVFVAIMAWYSGALTLIVLAMLGLIAALALAVTPLFRRRLEREFQAGAHKQAFLTETIANLETVKSLQMEPRLVTRHRALLADTLDASRATRGLANLYSTVASSLEQLLALLVLAVGATLVMDAAGGDTTLAGPGLAATAAGAAAGALPTASATTGFTIGMLVAFQMFAARLAQPLLRIVALWQEFQQARLAVRRLADILDAPAEVYGGPLAQRVGGPGRIVIDGLFFRHGPQQSWLLRDLSLQLEPGTLTVLMGPSGSGKSTLARLLLGFLQQESGTIRIDGVDVRHLGRTALRACFGVVPQDVALFAGTLQDNLLHAVPQASFTAVVRACQLAGIHTTIEALPEGYLTRVGERGVGLSGGQRQRLAIARALLRNPRVLIFDEATSALDDDTAAALAQTLNALHGALCVLFITHKVPRGLQVDQVVELANGTARITAVTAAPDSPVRTGHPAPLSTDTPAHDPER